MEISEKACLAVRCFYTYLSPAGLYAGHYDALDLPSLFRMLVFDGSFYHLWYFPACMLGLLLVCLLRRLLSVRGAAVAAVVLYFIGLSGDSYYGLISYIPIHGTDFFLHRFFLFSEHI